MADSAWAPNRAAALPATANTPRHTALVRVTHWITALCFFALLLSGIEILISHPRFYWGEDGNSLTPPLFALPIPASRASVPTGYGFVLPDQNGWSRALHFQTAWILVLTGLLYTVSGIFTRHFRKNLLPSSADLSWRALFGIIVNHLRFKPASDTESASYNVLQRLTYLAVIFVLFPVMVWTGLAMSPAVVSVFPAIVTVLGGQQSARTIHFFVTIALVVFVVVHLMMIFLAGFWDRTRGMITGRTTVSKEDA